MAASSLETLALRRIRREISELEEDDLNGIYFRARPLEDDHFEWHFTIRGPADSPFSGGIYHGRIRLPPDYPKKPPYIVFLTENGRWEINQKICLSVSSFHPEAWNPGWSIRTVLLAMIGFMPTKPGGAIASLDYSAEERRRLAGLSRSFVCDVCKIRNDQILLPDVANADVERAQQNISSFLAASEIKTLDHPAQIASSSQPSTETGAARNEPHVEALQDQQNQITPVREHQRAQPPPLAPAPPARRQGTDLRYFDCFIAMLSLILFVLLLHKFDGIV